MKIHGENILVKVFIKESKIINGGDDEAVYVLEAIGDEVKYSLKKGDVLYFPLDFDARGNILPSSIFKKEELSFRGKNYDKVIYFVVHYMNILATD